ncbi:MAG: hypothetical protein CL908_16470 [Deltaproteobacteria bacterium]|jgi:predicted DsbA family dithiol-disulfide isomerase|nr:hypothetical protein [Deltaproteobacteria bacterium]
MTQHAHPTRSRSLTTASARAVSWLGLLALLGCGPLGMEPGSGDASAGDVSANAGGDPGVALIIGEREVTIGELHEHMKEQFIEEFLNQPEDRIFEMHENAVRDLVQRHIVKTEAQLRGTTPEALSEEITGAVGEPSDEDVADWFAKNQARLRGAQLEDVAGQIELLLRDERRTDAWKAFIEPRLEALSWSMVLKPPRTELVATRLVRGNIEAPVTITAFSDYQCPYCIRSEPVLAEVLRRYPDQVRLVHRHFPLDSIHPFARPASEASMCAEEQGRFWDYHDAIFARQGRLEEGSFAEIGSELGLDAEALGQCIEERRYMDFVNADFTAGRDAGVTGTPAFFINGIALKGARDANELSRAVDAELSRIAAN